MAQIAMVSTQVEIKSPSNLFYGFFMDQIPQLAQIFPEAIKSYRLLEGNEIRSGTVIWGKYELFGSTMTLEAKVEVNDSSKTVSFIMIDGDILKHYNSFEVKYEVNNNGYVGITVEFEKRATDTSPNPDGYIGLASTIIKKFDNACLSRYVA